MHLALGFSGVKYDDEKNTESSVFNVILGSGMSSRLFQTVREKLGLCYTIYSYPSGPVIKALLSKFKRKSKSKRGSIVKYSPLKLLTKTQTSDNLSVFFNVD